MDLQPHKATAMLAILTAISRFISPPSMQCAEALRSLLSSSSAPHERHFGQTADNVNRSEGGNQFPHVQTRKAGIAECADNSCSAISIWYAAPRCDWPS